MNHWTEAIAEAKRADDATLGAAVVALSWTGFETADVTQFVSNAPAIDVARECHRALIPGAHAALWVPGRSNDLGGLALRLAGFEIRDTVAVAHGNDVSYWVLARKHLAGMSVIESTMERGTGGINIGATRVGASSTTGTRPTAGVRVDGEDRAAENEGRFSPNVLLDATAVTEMNRQAPSAGAGGPASGPTYVGESKSNSMAGKFNGMGDRAPVFHADSGGAARFFPKVSDDGCGVFGLDWIVDLVRTPAAPILVLSGAALSAGVSRKAYQTAR